MLQELEKRINAIDADVKKLKELSAEMNDSHNELIIQYKAFMSNFCLLRERIVPALESYERGMKLKAKVGSIAIGYIVLMSIYPKLSPSEILNLIKLVVL